MPYRSSVLRCLKALRLGVFASLALLPLPLMAQPQDCAAVQARVTIIPLWGVETLDNSKSQQEVQALSGLQQAHAIRGVVALGLTITDIVMNTRLRTEVLSLGGQPVCANLSELRLEFGFTPHIIYIPAQFKPMTCAYNAIYAHEARHVAVDRELLQRELPQLQARLNQELPALAKIYGDDAAAMRQTLSQRLDHMLKTLQADFIRRRQAAQAIIDSPAEYARVGASCDGELKL
jgi:ElaB/YqjD/DUF883 family membrane-anchored ribosome-binding protein